MKRKRAPVETDPPRNNRLRLIRADESREWAPSLLDNIHAQILELSKNVLPKSAAGEACTYTIKLWKKLTCFLEYPELELSNNLAENSMRGVALGRKNWIHIGSQQAGPRVAAILSVVESCRRLRIPVREYLNEILPGLANRSIQQVADITPAKWAARHSRNEPDSGIRTGG